MKYASELKLSDRVLRYSATASLITAGLLATSFQPSVAGTTITNIYDPSVGDLDPGETLAIDMDGAGGTEFTMRVFSIGIVPIVTSAELSVLGSASSGALYPRVLYEGDPVTYSQSWAAANLGWGIGITYNGTMWNWINEDGTQKHYMGVRFISENDSLTHYGWVEMTVTSKDNGGPHVVVHRTGIDTPAGLGLPASVELAGVQGASGLQAATASAFAALGGALTWIRRKLSA